METKHSNGSLSLTQTQFTLTHFMLTPFMGGGREDNERWATQLSCENTTPKGITGDCPERINQKQTKEPWLAHGAAITGLELGQHEVRGSQVRSRVNANDRVV